MRIHGSYDRVVKEHERIKVKRRFPCGCAILENGECVFCVKHWNRERIKRKLTEKEMEAICGEEER